MGGGFVAPPAHAFFVGDTIDIDPALCNRIYDELNALPPRAWGHNSRQYMGVDPRHTRSLTFGLARMANSRVPPKGNCSPDLLFLVCGCCRPTLEA